MKCGQCGCVNVHDALVCGGCGKHLEDWNAQSVLRNASIDAQPPRQGTSLRPGRASKTGGVPITGPGKRSVQAGEKGSVPFVSPTGGSEPGGRSMRTSVPASADASRVTSQTAFPRSADSLLASRLPSDPTSKPDRSTKRLPAHAADEFNGVHSPSFHRAFSRSTNASDGVPGLSEPAARKVHESTRSTREEVPVLPTSRTMLGATVVPPSDEPLTSLASNAENWKEVYQVAVSSQMLLGSALVQFGCCVMALFPSSTRALPEGAMSTLATLTGIGAFLVLLYHAGRVSKAVGCLPWPVLVLFLWMPGLSLLPAVVLLFMASIWLKNRGVRTSALGPDPPTMAELRKRAGQG